LRRAALLAVPLALLTALINPLVTHEGLTVIARLGSAPVLGQVDVTLEALTLGAIQGLRIGVVVLAGALYTAAVDPDEVLRGLRRLSVRSALAASVATRLVPVLARDGAQIADAQRCRPGAPAGRVAVLRAVTANALDRAVDVAAALEVRGFAAARRPPRRHRPLSRADLAVGGAALALVAVTLVARATGTAAFVSIPAIDAGPWGGPAALALLVLALGVMPFRIRRGIG
jgi:energy-coupling factor transport system permease protein